MQTYFTSSILTLNTLVILMSFSVALPEPKFSTVAFACTMGILYGLNQGILYPGTSLFARDTARFIPSKTHCLSLGSLLRHGLNSSAVKKG